MTKKNVSWPLFTVIGALGLGAALLGPACTVSSGDDDDLDVDAGAGGSTGGSSGGSKSTGGSAGASTGGSAGASTGGSAGASTGGSAGTGGGSGGSAGGPAEMLACEGTTVLPWPNCDADATDDSCTECLKTSCCDEWRNCVASDETSGDFVCGWGGPSGAGEFGCIAQCMRDGAADTAECIGDCTASSWDPAACSDSNITLATNELLGCIEAGACQTECFE